MKFPSLFFIDCNQDYYIKEIGSVGFIISYNPQLVITLQYVEKEGIQKFEVIRKI